jgi:dienelactone hydrolase
MQEIRRESVTIPVDEEAIEGDLILPPKAKGVVLFAHGSGSGRLSPRNQYVAKVLNEAGIATLLIDLLTKKEEEIDVIASEFRFDIDLLSKRLEMATGWLLKHSKTSSLCIGYYGASTGAAAALIAATRFPKEVKTVVSRGGRPDLAMGYLESVKVPVLFIVGGEDDVVLELNKESMEKIHAEKRLEVVPGATHLFEEPGKLEKVARISVKWFSVHLR